MGTVKDEIIGSVKVAESNVHIIKVLDLLFTDGNFLLQTGSCDSTGTRTERLRLAVTSTQQSQLKQEAR